MKYAYSLKTTRIKEPDFPYSGKKIKAATDVVSFASDIQNSDIEKFITLYLNSDNRINGMNITTGTVNCAMPHLREIFKHALLSASASIILIHNHPSGNLTPSEQDKKFTKEVRQAGELMGVKVLDHIIMGEDNKFFSFSEEGLL
jgi:DNA repair protein RadC